mgnify:CR=1 FL=1
MAEPAVFLIHGLGGTQYDLGSMHKRLKNAGFVTYSLMLPGHGTTPQDLVGVTAEDWIEAVRQKYLEVMSLHEEVHVMGMCMGALLAIETVKRERHTKGKLIALVPPLFYDGWATPWYAFVRYFLYPIPGVAARWKIEEGDPYGIKNEQLRAIVKAKFERGDNFHYNWFPLECVRQVDRLRAMVRKDLHKIEASTLVIHAREDDLTSLNSANYVIRHINGVGRASKKGQTKARMVVLEDSYHMVCVDNDKEVVAKNVLEFIGANAAGSLGVPTADAGMTLQQMQELSAQACRDLETGDFAALYARGIPDFAWYQPGHNRTTGCHAGNKGLARLQQWTAASDTAPAVKFTTFGNASLNSGMVVTPAVLSHGALQSPGVLALSMRKGKLLEARWFPDDVDAEDTHFGGEPVQDGPSPAEKAFEQASVTSKTLQKAPDNDTLLALYSLYKQGSVGDCSGARPGVMDIVGRAKFDAWMARKGQARDTAMSEYVELVTQLKAADSA